MLDAYFEYIMPQVQYEKDADGVIFAYVEDYPEYITEWDTFEEARENMMEVIEDIVKYKFQIWDTAFIKKFNALAQEYAYA